MPRLTLSALLLTLAAGPAFAQSERAQQEARYQAVTELDLEGLSLTANVESPNLPWINERPPATFPPMFKLRDNFNTEMKQSVDQVK